MNAAHIYNVELLNVGPISLQSVVSHNIDNIYDHVEWKTSQRRGRPSQAMGPPLRFHLC